MYGRDSGDVSHGGRGLKENNVFSSGGSGGDALSRNSKDNDVVMVIWFYSYLIYDDCNACDGGDERQCGGNGSRL